jgi:hypothetical protein
MVLELRRQEFLIEFANALEKAIENERPFRDQIVLA